MIRCLNVQTLVAGMTFALAMAACGQGSAPAGGKSKEKDWTSQGSSSIQDHSSKSPEEAQFVEKCGMCHRNMGMGTVLLARRMDPAIAKLEDRDDLTADYVIQVARSGLGNMPRIQPGEVSHEQLATIAKYLAKGETQ